MYRLISKLVVYKKLGNNSLLLKLADIIKEYDYLTERENPRQISKIDRENIISRIYSLINELLDMATLYGFNHNLWQDYLAYLLITMENPFSITCEKVGAREGTVNIFAKGDFKIFKKLFDYDFTPLEEALDINCFSIITNYKAIEKSSTSYNKNVSKKVRMISNRIATAKDEEEIFKIVTDFYRDYGVGKLGLNKAFRISKDEGKLE